MIKRHALSNDATSLNRVGAHEDRLQNLYFAYLFVLRAVTRAGPELENCFDTGDTVDDENSHSMIRRSFAASRSTPSARRTTRARRPKQLEQLRRELALQGSIGPGMSLASEHWLGSPSRNCGAQFVQRFVKRFHHHGLRVVREMWTVGQAPGVRVGDAKLRGYY